MNTTYPKVLDVEKVGEYSAIAYGGGGYVWDEVLEYRVWCHPERGAPDKYDGDDYYCAFTTFEDAEEFSSTNEGTEKVIALILQKEHINEPAPGVFEHKKENRITEWPAIFLSRPRRTAETLPAFFATDAPENKLDIIRGIA